MFSSVRCLGCGQIVNDTDEYPPQWVRLLSEDGEQAYCTRGCIVNAVYGREPTKLPWPCGLRDRDVDMLECIAQGKSNSEIAFRLGFAESTAKNRLSQVFRKLGVEDRTQAVMAAHVLGVLNLSVLAERFYGRVLPTTVASAA